MTGLRMDVLIVGGGIGGLTLGLMLHERGIPCRIYEAAPEIKPLGVGINILPHASKELCQLGLEAALAKVAVTTADARYFNRFGQLIFVEPVGRNAGYEYPQFSIHRGDLHQVLIDAFVARAGRDRFLTGWQCTQASTRTATAQPSISSIRRRARHWRPSAARSRSAATASTRRCASSSIPMKGRRSIPASTCGAA